MHGCVAGSGSVPGNLLRFDATIKLSSAANRTLFAQDAVKGIVMNDASNRTSYQPIDIAQLPYSAKPPVRALLHVGPGPVFKRCVSEEMIFRWQAVAQLQRPELWEALNSKLAA